MKPQLLIGALQSGGGKTTVTMGLLRALCRRGMQVQPFKCGPDYIDTRFHAVATGRDSVNLDTWLASEPHVREVYARYGTEADACVVEGVMGLFDGYERMQGSSAAIAQLLDIPVVLVVSARSTAYTVAALLHGVKTFRPGLHLAGVVFNQVGSERHAAMLREAAEDAGLRCFGCLPRAEGLEIPSRHLGLTLAAEEQMNAWIERAADLVEAHVDLDSLLEACNVPFQAVALPSHPASGKLRISVARDAAFNFIYRENLDRLSEFGPVTFFSPLAGDPLPESDLVYLPGGYPELFARELSSRTRTMEQLRDYAEAGGRILAECGGMIYLSSFIVCVGEGSFRMCGVLPFTATMEGARLQLGYRRLEDAAGRSWRGHEFHYSHLREPDALPSVARQYDARGRAVPTPLYRYKNVIAGYTHLYWGESGFLYLWDGL
jgi:cobyrinic acid a,c-diamide synthase